MVDRFSKMAYFIPYNKMDDVTRVEDLYFKKIVRLHDILKSIV